MEWSWILNPIIELLPHDLNKRYTGKPKSDSPDRARTTAPRLHLLERVCGSPNLIHQMKSYDQRQELRKPGPDSVLPHLIKNVELPPWPQ